MITAKEREIEIIPCPNSNRLQNKVDPQLFHAAKGTSLEKYACMLENSESHYQPIEKNECEERKTDPQKIEQLSYTMSSTMIQETIASPDIQQILRGLAMLLDSMIEKDAIPQNGVYGVYFDFSSNDQDKKPTVMSIFRLMYKIHNLTEWSSETVVIALILIMRLLGCGNMYLHIYNWKRIVMCALLLAQKVWDDRPLPTGELETLWKECLAEDRPISFVEWKSMEIKFLQIIGYDVSFSRRCYTKWYFELRALVIDPCSHYELSDPVSTHAISNQTGESCSNVHIVFEPINQRGKPLGFDCLGLEPFSHKEGKTYLLIS